MRGGSSKGSRMRRSSKRAMRSAFQFRRWTCQQPRAKAVMGINAVQRVLDVLKSCRVFGGMGVPSSMRPGPCFLSVDTRRDGRSTTDLKPGSSAGFAYQRFWCL